MEFLKERLEIHKQRLAVATDEVTIEREKFQIEIIEELIKEKELYEE